MKFTIVGDLYLTVNEARRWRRKIRLGELPEGVHCDLSRHDEYDREIVRHYPICLAVRAYEITREAFEDVKDNHLYIYPTDTATGGILGGDGGIGWTPAMNWEHEADAYNGSFGSVYVTPWPETVRPITRGHSWDRVVRALMATYA